MNLLIKYCAYGIKVQYGKSPHDNGKFPRQPHSPMTGKNKISPPIIFGSKTCKSPHGDGGMKPCLLYYGHKLKNYMNNSKPNIGESQFK